MPRPKAFVRDTALEQALTAFAANGFAATTTDRLVQAMGINKQSLYNTFGNKRQLFLEVLKKYYERRYDLQIQRLNRPPSPMAGIATMLAHAARDRSNSPTDSFLELSVIMEFGNNDPEINECREPGATNLHAALVERLKWAKINKDIMQSANLDACARFIEMMNCTFQVAARAGADEASLEELTVFVKLALSRCLPPVDPRYC